MNTTKIIVCGSKGRMGQAVVACTKTDRKFHLVAEVDVCDDLSQSISKCDVVVEFALHEATLGIAKIAAKHKKPLVIGTTGHTDAERKSILLAVRPIPVVWSANFSTGVNALFWMTEKVAALVEPEWGVEIIEAHHQSKKDSPSGTAKRLQEILVRHKGAPVTTHSLRLGDIVGDHTVVFATAGERLELVHRASSRETFARGALRAANWVASKKPGLYDMQDVLALRNP